MTKRAAAVDVYIHPNQRIKMHHLVLYPVIIFSLLSKGVFVEYPLQSQISIVVEFHCVFQLLPAYQAGEYHCVWVKSQAFFRAEVDLIRKLGFAVTVTMMSLGTKYILHRSPHIHDRPVSSSLAEQIITINFARSSTTRESNRIDLTN